MEPGLSWQLRVRCVVLPQRRWPDRLGRLRRLLVVTLALLASSEPAAGLDHVTLRREGREIEVHGRLLVKAKDGGLLLLAPDGVLWAVPPQEQIRHTTDEVPFRPLSQEELSARLLDELPGGFDVHRTAHYLVCYNTSRAYAQWCGSLLERLHMAFTNYWTRKGFKLSEPEFPLTAIVFADRRSYRDFAKTELGDSAGSIIAYYSLRTNRMTMYDLTGVAALGRSQRRRGTAAQVNQILSRPEAERTVATIVHEATHQIAFNCGLHTRYSDCPLWFSEGLAVYFEMPDLRSPKGWRNIGAVNRSRLARFRRYLSRRPADSLSTLLGKDQRLRDPKQTLDAYAEAWALTYFLVRQRPKQYVEYLELLSGKKPLLWDDPATRLREFQAVFGDLGKLDTEFLRHLERVR